VGSPCAQFDPALDLLASAASFAKVGALATPFVLGLFLGVPLVAREIEGRTTSIAWTLSGSRRRWLVHRAAPVVVIVVLAALLVGIGGEVLTRSAPGNEGLDPASATTARAARWWRSAPWRCWRWRLALGRWSLAS
jgi:hypothetical protein